MGAERALEDAGSGVGKNPKVKEEYEKALQSIADAKEAISGFVGVYNQEYRLPPEDE